MERKQRIDSATAAVEVMQAALQEIEVPACVLLADGDKPFWEAVIAARPNVEWNDADLITAGQLAKTLAKIETTTDIGDWDKLNRLALAMRRSLGLDVRATQRGADVANRRDKAREIERQNPMANDDLLARPSIN